MKIQIGVAADDKHFTPGMFAEVWLSPLLSCQEANKNLLPMGVWGEQEQVPQTLQLFILPALGSWGLGRCGSSKDPLFYSGVSVWPQLKDPALKTGSGI